jgi:hypothetical protein
MVSCEEIKNEYNLSISRRTVSRILSSCPDLKYKKKLCRTPLTAQHRDARISWSKAHLHWRQEWYQVVFLDEKKFNLDGPDGWAYYWNDIRENEVNFSTRQNDGGSVMVWACFGALGQSALVFIDGKMYSTSYCEMLRDHPLPVINDLTHPPVMFQQNNASSQKSKQAMAWLNDNIQWITDWPSKSPDLNPKENMWGILARAVYQANRQFSTKEELKAALVENWNAITEQYRLNLLDSMPTRVEKVISEHGYSSGY